VISLEEEQAELKRAFWDSVREMDDANNNEDEEGEGGSKEKKALFQRKPRTAEEQAREDAEFEEWKAKQAERQRTLPPKDELAVLRDFWASEKGLDANERFLRDYILNERWRDPNAQLEVPDDPVEAAAER
jgi:protein KRI1